MRHWLLPEGIEDLLPDDAQRVESIRRRLLDEFARHGYQLVAPPLLEYLEALLTGSGHDLEPRTFKLVDQLSGRTMGVRADITPQVARIDAHLLNRQGVTRLCYCGSVLHTRPLGRMSSREPLQIGAELYGHAGVEADSEIIRLLARTLELAAVTAAPAATRIDLGHVGIFRALLSGSGLSAAAEEDIFLALQAKDVPALKRLAATLAEPIRTGLLALPQLYGSGKVLDEAARCLPAIPAITSALATLHCLAGDLADLPIGFDLADLRGYHYHNGVVFAAYCQGVSGALALGGRYDEVGAAFGRARPATGFSLDLRELVRLTPEQQGVGAILAPWPEDATLRDEIGKLRRSGETVVSALSGHDGHWREAGCTRQLVRRGATWIIEPLKEA
jgi:ATP phosphoribosyltransferase regulatory subunit